MYFFPLTKYDLTAQQACLRDLQPRVHIIILYKLGIYICNKF